MGKNIQQRGRMNTNRPVLVAVAETTDGPTCGAFLAALDGARLPGSCEGRSWVKATCALTWWSKPALQPPLREGTVPTRGLTLMMSSNPRYLPKASPPDITLWIGASTWDFGGHTRWSVAARISPLA